MKDSGVPMGQFGVSIGDLGSQGVIWGPQTHFGVPMRDFGISKGHFGVSMGDLGSPRLVFLVPKRNFGVSMGDLVSLWGFLGS